MIIKQAPVVEPPMVRYEYSYSYDFRPEKATTTKALESDNSNSPLNLLSSAASAVVDEEESVSSSSSSQQAKGIRSASSTLSSSSPTPLKNQAPPVVDRSRQLPPVAFAVRRSPPSAAAFVTRISSSPTLSPTLPPPPAPAPVHQQQVLFPPHYSPTAYARSLHMPPGMEIPLAAKQTPIPTTVTSSRGKLAAKAASAFVPKVVAKKQTPKYKMKYQYVSMKRSEAIKYIEALSKSGASQVAAAAPPYVPQVWQQPQQYPPSPVSVRAPLPAAQLVRPIAVAIPANTARVYHLPLATAVIPRY